MKSTYMGDSDTDRAIWFYTSNKYEVTLPAIFMHSYIAGSIASVLLTIRTSTEKLFWWIIIGVILSIIFTIMYKQD